MLYRKMLAADIDAASEIERHAPDPWNKAQLTALLQDGVSHSYIAEENSVPVAFCSVQKAADEATINAVTVLPSHRQRGVARGLLLHVQAALLREGVKEMFLEVRAGNTAAQALYASMGFAAVGMRKNFYEHPCENAIVMQKTFTAQSE